MRKRSIAAAFAALALCGLYSCSGEPWVEEPAAEKTGQTWSVSVDAAKAVQDPGTKALLLSDDESNIRFCWAGTDKVEVYDSGENLRGTLVPDETGTNTTRLKGTLSGDFTLGQTFTLYFLKKPAAENAYAAQKGTVSDIARNFDFATASVEVKEVDTGNGTVVFTHAAFESRQSITKFKFHFVSNAPQDRNIVKLTILAAGRMDPVTVIPDTPADEFHVALPKIDSGGEKLVYTFLAEVTNGSVYEGTRKAALQAGKYYKGTVGLSKYDPITTPLTIEALEDGEITISNPLGKKIWWNADGEGFDEGLVTGTTQTSTDNPIEIPVTTGQRVILGGYNSAYASVSYSGSGEQLIVTTTSTNIRCTVRHYVYGNVMSLIDASAYKQGKTLGDYAVMSLFDGDQTLYNHPVKTLELPATTVGKAAYASMFGDCTNLEVAPELPATTFSGTYEWTNDGPYHGMFTGCTSLKKAPSILPAKTVYACYLSMFEGCTSLEASPILEDKYPADRAYSRMFFGCSNLKQITCYAQNNLWPRPSGYVWDSGKIIDIPGAPDRWVRGVSPTGVFIKHPNASWPVGDSGIPAGWTSDKDPLIIEAIEGGTITINNPKHLSITWSKDASMAAGTTSSQNPISISVSAGDKVRLWGDNPVYSGYDGTIYDKSNNTTITGTAPYYVYGDISSLVSSGGYPNLSSLPNYAFAGLFEGDSYLRSHEDLNLTIGSATVGERTCQDMFAGCTGLKRAPLLPATELGAGCYENMFAGCTSLTEPPALNARNLADFCYSGMFYGCTSLDTAPELPATTIYEGCYMNMFTECTSLKQSPLLAASVLKPDCYAFMFSRCTSLKKISCAASNISASGALESWVADVPTGSGGTFVKRNGVSWPTGPSGIPSGWNVVSQ